MQGPFSTFCIPALVGPYVPDLTVMPGDAACQYLCVYREDYKRAIEVCQHSTTFLRFQDPFLLNDAQPLSMKSFPSFLIKPRAQLPNIHYAQHSSPVLYVQIV